jgi:transcriptional regulator with XRE-family HTH domain
MNNWNRPSTTPERLKVALGKAKMKQSELCRLTGLDKGAVSSYLSGKYEPKSDAINKMAIALDVDEMWLWGYDVPMEREKNTPEKLQLTEGEKMLLELFRQVPVESQQMVLDMIRIALKK